MNPVGVGHARIDGPVLEGGDMLPCPADLREPMDGTGTAGALDAEFAKGSRPGFGPCQKHLETADGDSDQVGRHRRKDEEAKIVCSWSTLAAR